MSWQFRVLLLSLKLLKKTAYFKGNKKNPIEIITGRVKTPESILEKAKRLSIPFSEISKKNL